MRIDEAVVNHLKSTVVGDIKGLDAIGSAILLYNAGLSPDDKPAGSFFMSGPTGTGKTWLTESLAAFIHGNEKMTLRVDCGSYTAEHDVAKLVGSPPGYLGHKETPPLLCDANVNGVYRTPKSNLTIVVFDEIDKAAHALPKLILSILDKGVLRTGDNTPVSYKDTLVFFTSNHGQSAIHKIGEVPMGFSSGEAKEATPETISVLTKRAIVKTLPPEFIGRVDNWIHFSPLDKEEMTAILSLEVGKIEKFLNTRVAGATQTIKLTDSAIGWILARGYSKEYGARPLKRLLRKEVLERVAIKLASGTTPKIVSHTFSAEGDALVMNTEAVKASA